eukprot:1733247-Rhodomonas_salina.1
MFTELKDSWHSNKSPLDQLLEGRGEEKIEDRREKREEKRERREEWRERLEREEEETRQSRGEGQDPVGPNSATRPKLQRWGGEGVRDSRRVRTAQRGARGAGRAGKAEAGGLSDGATACH